MKTVLVIFLFCISCTYTFSDTYFFSIIDYLNLALENNIKLKIAKLSYLKEQALTNLQMEVLKPQLSVNSDPLYGFSNSRLFNEEKIEDYYTHNSNIGFAFSSLIPTGGTVIVSLSDSISFGTIDQKFLNNPVLSINFSQPIFVNDGFFNIKGYKSEILAPKLTREIAQMDLSQSTNQHILELINEYYSVLGNEKKMNLLRQKVNVFTKELKLFEIRKNQGSLSVIDYWEKELEVKNLEREVYDMDFILSTGIKKLGSLVGLNTSIVDISLNDIIPNIMFPEKLLFENSFAYRIENVKTKLNYLEIQTAMKNYAPTLGINLSINPQYPLIQSGSKDFTESITNLWDSNSWIKYSGSIVFSLPLSLMKQGQLENIALVRKADIEKLELEETRSSFSDEITELYDKITYLKTKGQYLTEQLEYSIKRKAEKEKFYQIDSSSSLEVAIAEVDVDTARNDLFNNNVEIFLAILDLYNLNGSSIYDLFL